MAKPTAMQTGTAQSTPARTISSGGSNELASAEITDSATMAPTITTSPWAKLISCTMQNHRISQRDDGIHAAQGQAVDELLEEDVQGESAGDADASKIRADGPVRRYRPMSTKENSTRRCRFQVEAVAPPTSRLHL